MLYSTSTATVTGTSCLSADEYRRFTVPLYRNCSVRTGGKCRAVYEDKEAAIIVILFIQSLQAKQITKDRAGVDVIPTPFLLPRYETCTKAFRHGCVEEYFKLIDGRIR